VKEMKSKLKENYRKVRKSQEMKERLKYKKKRLFQDEEMPNDEKVFARN